MTERLGSSESPPTDAAGVEPPQPADAFDSHRFYDLAAKGRADLAAAQYEAADPHPDEVRAAFGLLTAPEAAAVIAAIKDDAKAREILLWLPQEQGASVAAQLEPAMAARLVAALPSDERADLLSAMEAEPRTAVHAALPAEIRADTARLLTYPADTAGGLMETEFLAYSAATTAADAIRDIRANRERYRSVSVQYLYVLDGARRPVGVAPMRDLLLAPSEETLGSLVKRDAVVVRDTATLQELADVFDEHGFLALPVVDSAGAMVGVLSRADLEEGETEEAEDRYRVSQGIVGGEELRSMPITRRLRRRAVWLGVNLLLCLAGAAVIARHGDTLAEAIVVAAVLPLISATSGNAAMQAAAVSIRELTLGVIDPRGWRRVLGKELTLAGLMAPPLGLAAALLARLWGADWKIGLAVGAGMAINAVIAVGIGAVCPLILRRVRVDPALASGPITTTLADVSGFTITLTLVAALLK